MPFRNTYKAISARYAGAYCFFKLSRHHLSTPGTKGKHLPRASLFSYQLKKCIACTGSNADIAPAANGIMPCCRNDTMPAIYSYVLRYDDGTAPNPFWEVCTLAICKPAIRRGAAVGDWVVGTGSRQVRLPDGKKYDFSDSLVYAMRVTEKMTLPAYDWYCRQQLSQKIPQPQSADWRLLLGDCVYAFNGGEMPEVRDSYHGSDYASRDLNGIYVLLSTQFYYFGAAARFIPPELRPIIKKNQGHLRIENKDLLDRFEAWIQQFETNMLYGNPQLQFKTVLPA